jgi:hypothetical protein
MRPGRDIGGRLRQVCGTPNAHCVSLRCKMNGYLKFTVSAALVFFAGCTRESAVPTGRPSVAANVDGTEPLDGVNASPAVAIPAVKSRPIDPYTLDYDPDTVVTLRGQILGFRRIALSDERTGLFARVHSGGGLPWVYLGPEPWLKDRGMALAMTQEVSVIGSRVNEDDQPLIVAREITTGDTQLELRDEWGTPRWALPLGTVSTEEIREQDLKRRREEYLKRVLAYHEREAEAIRAKLRLEQAK